jgi:hypothetical protein
METMRIKRQPRAKRQKTNRETSQTCEPSPVSLSESPDMATESQFTGSSAAVSPTSDTPMNGLSSQYTSQFHSEPEQSLPTSQDTNGPNWNSSSFSHHRAGTHQWSPPDFNHPGNMHNSLPYGVAPMPQQTFPFTLPGCSPPADPNPSPAGLEQYYSTQTQSPTQLNFNSISLDHSLGPIPDVKMASQPASAYPAWIGEQRWDSTPAASYSQYQTPNNHPPHNY